MDPAAKDLEPLKGWPELSAVLTVETIRGVSTGKVEAEIRYFLTSCGDDPAVLVQAIRRHWGIENALPWGIDLTFREDDSRVRDRLAARNLALCARSPSTSSRSPQSNQPTRPAQHGGLERRFHAPDHPWPTSCVNPGRFAEPDAMTAVLTHGPRVLPGHRPMRATTAPGCTSVTLLQKVDTVKQHLLVFLRRDLATFVVYLHECKAAAAGA